MIGGGQIESIESVCRKRGQLLRQIFYSKTEVK